MTRELGTLECVSERRLHVSPKQKSCSGRISRDHLHATEHNGSGQFPRGHQPVLTISGRRTLSWLLLIGRGSDLRQAKLSVSGSPVRSWGRLRLSRPQSIAPRRSFRNRNRGCGCSAFFPQLLPIPHPGHHFGRQWEAKLMREHAHLPAMVGFMRKHVSQHFRANRPRPSLAVSVKLLDAAPPTAERFSEHLRAASGAPG